MSGVETSFSFGILTKWCSIFAHQREELGICVVNGKTVLSEMLEVFLHCVSGEMSIFVSQEAFTNMHVNRPAAELDTDMFFGGLSISL